MKTTKKALLSAIVAVVITCSMFIGSTFAWFTDQAESKGNKVVAGKLDVKLWHHTSATSRTEIAKTEGNPLFKDDIVWEPGKTEVRYLSIENAGSLDLKYSVAINVYGIKNNMQDAMLYSIIPDAKIVENEVTEFKNGLSVTPGVNPTEVNNVSLKKEGVHYFAIAIHMKEEADESFMEGEIMFDIKLLAGQLSSENEKDAFGWDYDSNATYGDGAFFINSDELEVTGATEGDVVTLDNEDKTFVVKAQAGSTGVVKASIDPASSTEAALALKSSGKEIVSYNINVSGHKDGTPVTVELFIGKNLYQVEVLHAQNPMDQGDYTYDSVSGILTITTTSFSPFEVAYSLTEELPIAKVTKLDLDKVNATFGIGGDISEFDIDVAYIFEMTQTPEESANSPYAKWHVDFVIMFDQQVKGDEIALLGYYEAFCEQANNGNWVALTADANMELDAKAELRLLKEGLGLVGNYEELGIFVQMFKCGATKMKDSLIGKTLTVQLCMFEVEEPSAENGNSWNVETGEKLIVCEYSHTFR